MGSEGAVMGLFRAKYRINIGYGFDEPVYQVERKRGLGPWLIVAVFADLDKARDEVKRLRGEK